VFELTIVLLHVLAHLEYQILLYVSQPPVNEVTPFDVSDILIVLVHGVIDKVAFTLHNVPQVHNNVHVPDHIIIALVLLTLEENVPIERSKLFAENVPNVTLREFVAQVVNASCSVRVHPGAAKVKFFAHVFPAFVRVCVVLHSKVYACVLAVRVIPLTSVIEPNTLAAVLVVHVGVFVTPVQLVVGIRGMS